MSLFFGETEITNIDNLVPQSGLDITDVWFGTANIYTVWSVYEGTLPATFNANGDNMKQYQIWGDTGGVGDDSGTAYGYEVDMSVSDGTNTTATPIYIGDTALQKDEYVDYDEQKVYRRTRNLLKNEFVQGGIYPSSGNDFDSNSRARTPWSNAPQLNAGTYTINADYPSQATVNVYNLSKTYLKSESVYDFASLPITFTISTSRYVRFAFKQGDSIISPSDLINIMLNSGSSSLSYEPYLQPQDPPVALPALPTCDGTTIVDYAGQSVATPEKVLLEYRKEGF